MDGLLPATPDMLAIVGRLIATYFPHLQGARLLVAMREQAADAGDGKVMVAATGVLAGAPFEYIIWFALDAWAVISDSDKEALAFHELTHCGRDEQGRAELRPHDQSVFTEEVKLYGAWWQDAQQRFKSARDAGESS